MQSGNLFEGITNLSEITCEFFHDVATHSMVGNICQVQITMALKFTL